MCDAIKKKLVHLILISLVDNMYLLVASLVLSPTFSELRRRVWRFGRWLSILQVPGLEVGFPGVSLPACLARPARWGDNRPAADEHLLIRQESSSSALCSPFVDRRKDLESILFFSFVSRLYLVQLTFVICPEKFVNIYKESLLRLAVTFI